MNKIEHIEKCFRSAHDFANSKTCAGLKRQNEVLSMMPFVKNVHGIFQDQALLEPN